ncbi:MAG: type II toxin-antitoxin system VapC family toxin [Gammaproteobacteria bacterium]|nr:type II toxin-antitoxin system VapC family toxin [Gammaproteobacteria bacterium]
MVAGYLLDTNVLSEFMRPTPEPRVLRWFEAQQGLKFLTTAVTRAELLLGVALLPPGKRRDRIALAIEQTFEEDFAGNCLPFDTAAAGEYAILVAARVRAGKPISTEDAQIAAIALTNGLTLVTRNHKDFVAIAGLALVDPWTE